MNPIFILAGIAGLGALLLGGKKAPEKAAPIPGWDPIKKGPAGLPPAAKTPSTKSDPAPTVPTLPTPPIKIQLPLPSTKDYPTFPPSGNLDPMLSQSEQFELANYGNDKLYEDAMLSDHLAFVAAAATKLASSGDTRAADLTLRVANWGK
jgi:hypothetical protein